MIWTLLGKVQRSILVLAVWILYWIAPPSWGVKRPPSRRRRPLPVIHKDPALAEPCPACGNRTNRTLRCVAEGMEMVDHDGGKLPEVKPRENGSVGVMQFCGECSAKWVSKTAYEVATGKKPELLI